MSCVFPGFTAVFASSLRFVSILIKEDFPTLDLPIKAYSCRSEGGHLDTSALLTINSAFLISIVFGLEYLNYNKVNLMLFSGTTTVIYSFFLFSERLLPSLRRRSPFHLLLAVELRFPLLSPPFRKLPGRSPVSLTIKGRPLKFTLRK